MILILTCASTVRIFLTDTMLKVAIQGYEGCFHQIAANKYFGRDIEIMPHDTFRGVAAAVKSGEADKGVMAIENSIAGSIIANYSILQDANLQVAGEVYLPVMQNLMALPGVKLDDIREVESHPMALLQCVEYLDQHPWKLIESEDTALSARHIAEKGLRHTAAIASELAAEMFGLQILASEVNTIKSNYTRFMILKRHDHNIDSNVWTTTYRTSTACSGPPRRCTYTASTAAANDSTTAPAPRYDKTAMMFKLNINSKN